MIKVVRRPKFQPVQGRMLTTETCSPLQRFSPASHSLIVWFCPSAPTRMHTFIPGSEQSAESRQWHSLVCSGGEKFIKMQILSFKSWVFTRSVVPTVAALPHVTVAAACRVTYGPFANAVFCYHVLLPYTLHGMHLTNSQELGPVSPDWSGAHLQRWTGESELCCQRGYKKRTTWRDSGCFE